MHLDFKPSNSLSTDKDKKMGRVNTPLLETVFTQKF